jgi:hypothetical protein
MNNKKKQIEEEVKKTLDLLDQVEEIEPNPYFYTRLQGRLRNQEAEQRSALFHIFRAKNLRLAFLAIVIVINIVSGIVFLQNGSYQTYDGSENLDAIAREYFLTNEDFSY